MNGAQVRAGLNSDRVSNRLLATFTITQSTDGNLVLTTVANPAVSARYVSVDIPGSGKILHMSEVMVDEYMDEEAAVSTGDSNSQCTHGRQSVGGRGERVPLTFQSGGIVWFVPPTLFF